MANKFEDRLLRIINETMTPFQQRTRKWRMVNEDAGDVQIELTGKQVKELDKIFNEFGSDLDSVLSSNLEEAEKPDYSTMSSSQLEELGVTITIDKSIIDGIDELLELGKDAKDWYREINQKILEAFPDEKDGTLFLIILAIFAAGASLTNNFRIAARAFYGFKSDIQDPQKKAELEEIAEKYSKTPSKLNAEFHKGNHKGLATFTPLDNVPYPNSYIGNMLRLISFYKSKGYNVSKDEAIKAISQHFTPTGLVSKSSIISAEKIFSFTLNLLDPDFQFEGGWLPVTMDTWMASFFYPQLSKKERDARLSAKGGINYVYLAKLTQELAPRYGMTPIQFQAAIWVGKIKKTKGERSVSTFLESINTNLKAIDKKIQEFEGVDNFLGEIIKALGTAKYLTPAERKAQTQKDREARLAAKAEKLKAKG
jgi:hypothetical protein